MLNKDLILEIFKPADMQRWNDQLRPVDFFELDKQAHKMIIAYILGKFEEENETKDFNWIKIIEGGMFEFFQRIIVTDLKPPLFYKIKQNRKKYTELNNYVLENIGPVLNKLNTGKLFERFEKYLREDENHCEDINKKILKAAHFYATRWEFAIIERTNPNGYQIKKIKEDLDKEQEKTYGLIGMQKLTLIKELKDFADLCGELRFQTRWNHLHRIPKTSVLGHMLIVAMFSYLFSIEIKCCEKRCFNNYFTGLFHDLPEVLTRDIIKPVKTSVKGLDKLVKSYEKEEMKKIYKLIPKSWHREMNMFTEDEFSNTAYVNKKYLSFKNSSSLNKYNEDQYNPRDGEIVEVLDKLAAFTEAYLALENGIKNKELHMAKVMLPMKYKNYICSEINIGKIYDTFK
jgi:putative hydrolases of HD superfamily